MTRLIPILTGVAIAAAALAGTAIAQGVTQNTLPKPVTTQMPSVAAQPYGWKSVDAKMLGDGYRSSKFVGSSVVNETNDTIGTVDDLIIMTNDKAPYAVISVGGFLGMGAKYVVVPYNALEIRDNQVILRGATKDSLKALDEYKYPT